MDTHSIQVRFCPSCGTVSTVSAMCIFCNQVLKVLSKSGTPPTKKLNVSEVNNINWYNEVSLTPPTSHRTPRSESTLDVAFTTPSKPEALASPISPVMRSKNPVPEQSVRRRSGPMKPAEDTLDMQSKPEREFSPIMPAHTTAHDAPLRPRDTSSSPIPSQASNSSTSSTPSPFSLSPNRMSPSRDEFSARSQTSSSIKAMYRRSMPNMINPRDYMPPQQRPEDVTNASAKASAARPTTPTTLTITSPTTPTAVSPSTNRAASPAQRVEGESNVVQSDKPPNMEASVDGALTPPVSTPPNKREHRKSSRHHKREPSNDLIPETSTSQERGKSASPNAQRLVDEFGASPRRHRKKTSRSDKKSRSESGEPSQHRDRDRHRRHVESPTSEVLHDKGTPLEAQSSDIAKDCGDSGIKLPPISEEPTSHEDTGHPDEASTNASLKPLRLKATPSMIMKAFPDSPEFCDDFEEPTDSGSSWKMQSGTSRFLQRRHTSFFGDEEQPPDPSSLHNSDSTVPQFIKISAQSGKRWSSYSPQKGFTSRFSMSVHRSSLSLDAPVTGPPDSPATTKRLLRMSVGVHRNSASPEPPARVKDLRLGEVASAPFGSMTSPRRDQLVFDAEPPVAPMSHMQREMVAQEIMHTEYEYLKDLFLLLNVKNDLLNEASLSKYEVKNIFGSIEQIYNVSRDLYLKMKKMDAINSAFRVTPNLPVDSIELDCLIGEKINYIVQAFIDSSDTLKLYVGYTITHNKAVQSLENIEKDVDFRTILERITSKPEYKNMALRPQMIKPVQRICRYPLLLKELIKSTDTTPFVNQEKLVEALSGVETAVTHVNDVQRSIDRENGLRKAQDELLERGVDMFIISPSRTLIIDGIASLSKHIGGTISARNQSGKTRAGFYYLFDDMLLFIKKSSMAKQKKVVIPLDMVLVSDPMQPETALEVVHVGNQIYTFHLQTYHDKVYLLQKMEFIIEQKLEENRKRSK